MKLILQNISFSNELNLMEFLIRDFESHSNKEEISATMNDMKVILNLLEVIVHIYAKLNYTMFPLKMQVRGLDRNFKPFFSPNNLPKCAGSMYCWQIDRDPLRGHPKTVFFSPLNLCYVPYRMEFIYITFVSIYCSNHFMFFTSSPVSRGFKKF